MRTTKTLSDNTFIQCLKLLVGHERREAMITGIKTNQKQFYLVSVDLIQGLSIIGMVVGHSMLWWDGTINLRWPEITLIVAAFFAVIVLAHPCFFFLYGFNVANSLLRKENELNNNAIRSRYLKRTIIFFLIAEACEASAAIVTSPEHLLNFLLTWELFHIFALSTILLLVIFEIAWKLEARNLWNHKQVVTTIISLLFFLVIVLYLLFHDYSMTQRIKGMYVELDFNSIFQRVFFEDGQNPIIPWLSFSLAGGLVASILDFPHELNHRVLKKAVLILIGGCALLITGVSFLGKEGYVTTPFFFPASSSFVLIAIGLLVITTIVLLIFIDLTSLSSQRTVNKLLSPLVLISKISLTVYIIHNVAYVIPSDQPIIRTLIPSETAMLIVGFLYSVVFMVISSFWQRWQFKYSLEWMIWKIQNAQWLRGTN